jgi:hypothetical protein
MSDQPKKPRNVSEADAKRIEAFKTILLDWHAENLHKPLLDMYFRYSQLVCRGEVNAETENELYTLQLFIETLA